MDSNFSDETMPALIANTPLISSWFTQARMWHEGDVYRAQRGRGATSGLGAQDMLISGKPAIAEPTIADVAGPYRGATAGSGASLSIGQISPYGASQRASGRSGEMPHEVVFSIFLFGLHCHVLALTNPITLRRHHPSYDQLR